MPVIEPGVARESVLARLPSPRDVSMFETTLFCLFEHLSFRPTVPVDAYRRLTAFAARYQQRASAKATPFQLDGQV